MKGWWTALLILMCGGCGRVGFDFLAGDGVVDGTDARPFDASTVDAAVNCLEVEGPPGDPSCADNVDNDCDSLIDEVDPDCGSAACMVVTTALDEGDGGESGSPPHQGTGLSLREAITLANGVEGPDCIVFGGPMTITLVTPLPEILAVGGLRINGGEEVILEDVTGLIEQGLKLNSDNNAILGLHLRGFTGLGGMGIDVRMTGNIVGPGVEIESCGNGIRVEGANAKITGNRLHNNVFHGIQLFDGTTDAEVTLNLLYLNLEDGIQAKATSGVVLRHNTIYGNDVGFDAKMNSTGLVVENNLFVGNTGAAVNAVGSTLSILDYSGYFNNGNDCAGCTIGSNSMTEDPLLANPSAGDFSLSSGSPAIDRGMESGLDTNGGVAGLYNGSGPDLGALEAP